VGKKTGRDVSVFLPWRGMGYAGATAMEEDREEPPGEQRDRSRHREIDRADAALVIEHEGGGRDENEGFDDDDTGYRGDAAHP
jgi:hypothetical protein